MLQYHSTCAQLSWLPIVPSLPQARLPVVALMGVSLLGERLLVDRLHMWLEVDGQDQVGEGWVVNVWVRAMEQWRQL